MPHRHQEVFDIVIGARDAALSYLQESYRQGTQVQGWQADRVAREYICLPGVRGLFHPPLGPQHRIRGPQRSRQPRRLRDPGTPGTSSQASASRWNRESYLPEFGVRSEIDVFMSEDGPIATSPVQREVVLIG